jgi:hypothetical protein
MELEVTLVEIQTEHPIMNPERPIYISTRSHRGTTLTMYAAQSGQFTGILPFRYFSMTGLFARFRNLASAVQGANATAAYRLGSSINPNVSQYYFTIANN